MKQSTEFDTEFFVYLADFCYSSRLWHYHCEYSSNFSSKSDAIGQDIECNLI